MKVETFAQAYEIAQGFDVPYPWAKVGREIDDAFLVLPDSEIEGVQPCRVEKTDGSALLLSRFDRELSAPFVHGSWHEVSL
ncbi:hypothetical protein [Corynebacterium uterequi]|uniref:Uncharacterized protein n=1 Tax=Corynebacterium uterequi TaxID=1072256 RepID=A0A0G3HH05_9CORY|nr:hypothetical protein [Corynebacterium uterequi]AKK12065.1 hypothetical protein CUTER_10505 [Corynebacterium uterequi]